LAEVIIIKNNQIFLHRHQVATGVVRWSWCSRTTVESKSIQCCNYRLTGTQNRVSRSLARPITKRDRSQWTKQP